MDEATKTRYQLELGEAVARYGREKRRAARIEREAIDRLVAMIEKAHTSGGLRKSEILKAMGHELSRSWLDRVLPAKRSETAGQ